MNQVKQCVSVIVGVSVRSLQPLTVMRRCDALRYTGSLSGMNTCLLFSKSSSITVTLTGETTCIDGYHCKMYIWIELYPYVGKG